MQPDTNTARNKRIYWIATGLVVGVMAYSAVNFNLKNPLGPMKGAFAHLLLPDYFRIELTVAKALGVLALLLPRVSVMTLISETDLIGTGLSGFWNADQPDNAKLRIWEMPGTAHVDNYMFMVGALDNGSAPLEKIAALWKPTDALLGAKMAHPINSAPQHHYVAVAAMAALDRWVSTGKAPPKAPRMDTEPPAKAGDAPKLVADAQGNTKGGIRTPWVDAPTARLSGFGNTGGPFGFLVGTTEPFDAATLARLYPGGKAEYLKRFDASLDRAVKGGFILKADAPEIRALAAENWPAG